MLLEDFLEHGGKLWAFSSTVVNCVCVCVLEKKISMWRRNLDSLRRIKWNKRFGSEVFTSWGSEELGEKRVLKIQWRRRVNLNGQG